MIGLSSSYYGLKGLSIYESVKRVADLGFSSVELGAAHVYEADVWSTLKRVKSDFPDLTFSIHQLFPPREPTIWFNSANGLTPVNREILEGLFEAASITGASLVSIHAPLLQEVTLGGRIAGNFHEPILGDVKDARESKQRFFELMHFADRLAREAGVHILIENMNSELADTFPTTSAGFREILDTFSHSDILLDVGHALQCNNLDDLLQLKAKIPELHLHETGRDASGELWAHFPIKSRDYFEPLKNILTNEELVIFEHGADVSEDEILHERHLLESFMRDL